MTESVKTTFGERLQAVRRAYGTLIGEQDFPRSAFATLLGVQATSYTRYEQDEIEPMTSVLCRLREVTGVSIDHLLGFDTPGITDLERYDRACSASAGQRIRYIREMVTPDVAKIARQMGVRTSQYLRWESDMEIMPTQKMEEFARRFSVSVDYLARGLPIGIAPEALEQLLAVHPNLWSTSTVSSHARREADRLLAAIDPWDDPPNEGKPAASGASADTEAKPAQRG